jgi:exodeoxyribonuclease-3
MYVPNRGNDWAKTERKRAFLECWLNFCRASASGDVQRILLGDLNVVPTDQRPVFLPQQQFEYDWFVNLESAAGLYDAAVRHGPRHESTWVAHNGEGYTYDHIMLQKSLAKRVISFQYDHSTRQERALTDHSALVLTMDVDSVQRLSVSPIGQPRQTQLF